MASVIICGGNLRPGMRDSCPNELHNWPLPDGYIEAHDVAMSRLRRRWASVRCSECGKYGWRPGQINPETDVLSAPNPKEQNHE